MFDMILPTCSRDEKGAWHFAWSDLSVFAPDVDETDLSLRWGGGVGTLKVTLPTEAGILVFDMGG